MASGIPLAKWNNADVSESSVDVAAIRRWYEPRRVPWGLRVPVEIELDVGEPLFVKRCVAMLPRDAPTSTSPDSFPVRRELDPLAYAALESAAFAGELSVARAWVEPQFADGAFRHWVAASEGRAAAIGTTVRTDGDAGPASYLTGLALLPDAPLDALRALVGVAAADAFASGADFVHANPVSAADDAVLAPHDPIEVPGWLIRLCGTSPEVGH